MASRRRGNLVGYWGTLDASGVPQQAAITGATFSNKLYINESVMNYALLVSVSGATDITLWAANSTQLNPEGDSPDRSVVPADTFFHPVQWNSTPSKITFASSGSAYMIVPNFVCGWTAVQSSNAVSIYAGYEAL